jgi:hypothetical protein
MIFPPLLCISPNPILIIVYFSFHLENTTDIVESAKAVKQESVNPIDANEPPATAAAIAGTTSTNTTSPSTAPQTPQIQPIVAPRYNQEILDLSKQIEVK